jgi:hypothetical protein
MLAVLLTSIAPVRQKFYEFFLHAHILLVAVFLFAMYTHLQGLPQQIFVKIAIICWVAEV